MNLILLTGEDAVAESTYVLKDNRFKHISSVLRAKEGDTLRVGIPNGPVGLARIVTISSSQVTLRAEQWSDAPGPSLIIDVICAVPRPKTLKKVFAVTAAMGVRHLHLVRANRTDKSYIGSPLLDKSGYLPYLLDGLSQARQTRLPAVFVHPLFRPFVEDQLPDIASSPNLPLLKLLAHPDTENPLERVFHQATSGVLLAIGPEGGWVPFEIDLLRQQGFTPFALGPWTLRVESALVAALAQIEQVRSAISRDEK